MKYRMTSSGRPGRNFRCQACANVWHAMRSDALGYEEEKESEPFIEPIPVSEPPTRPWPSEKEEFTVPADTKSGKKTPSSFEILAAEGRPCFCCPGNENFRTDNCCTEYGCAKYDGNDGTGSAPSGIEC